MPSLDISFPCIKVRVSRGADPVHRGVLSIRDWEVPCVVGKEGLVEQVDKREGDKKTPIGVFPLRYGFFDPVHMPDLASRCVFPFLPMSDDMVWQEDATGPHYNCLIFVPEDSKAQERLTQRRAEKLYDLIVPIGYNDGPVKRFAGSAHFIHAARPDMSGTAGCVAVRHDDLEELARRLEPGMVIDINYEDAAEIVPSTVLPSIESVRFSTFQPGPDLLVLGAVHGNEICGPKAIRKVIDEIRGNCLSLVRGSVTFVPVVNYKAFLQNTREGDRNLNRDLREAPISRDNEDRVANILCPLLRSHDVLLDIHSFKSHGEPFVFAGPSDNQGTLEPFNRASEERKLANCLGVNLVMSGWLETFASGYPDAPFFGVGTTEYMRFSGGYAVTLECGNHIDPKSSEVAYKAILNTLAQLQMIQAPEPEIVVKRHIKLVKVILAESEQDTLEKTWRTGDPVKVGEVIARRHQGEVLSAPENGYVVFPNATAKKGETLFYFAVEETISPVP